MSEQSAGSIDRLPKTSVAKRRYGSIAKDHRMCILPRHMQAGGDFPLAPNAVCIQPATSGAVVSKLRILKHQDFRQSMPLVSVAK